LAHLCPLLRSYKSIAPLPRALDVQNRTVKGLQKAAFIIIKKKQRPFPTVTLTKRLGHLLFKEIEGMEEKAAKREAMRVANANAHRIAPCFAIVKKHLPINCSLSYLKALCNCWHTSTRDGHIPEECKFGCRSSKVKDTLSHYLRCPITRTLAEHIFGALGTWSGILQLFSLDSETQMEKILARALIIDATYFLYIVISHQSNQPSWDDVLAAYRARISDMLSKKPGIVSQLPVLKRLRGGTPAFTPLPATPPQQDGEQGEGQAPNAQGPPDQQSQHQPDTTQASNKARERAVRDPDVVP